MTRPKTITLSPEAADADGIATQQSPGASEYFSLDGALVTTLSGDRDGICAAQTPTGAEALSLDGAYAYRYFPIPTYVTIYAGNDESGKTFNVHGIDGAGNKLVETITGPNTTTVAGSIRFSAVTAVYASAATTGDVEVGFFGIAEFSTPQHVTVTAAGDVQTVTFTVTGLDRDGNLVTGTITGVDTGTVASTQNFSAVLKVQSDGTGTNTSVGVDGTCESGWIPLNATYSDETVAIGCTLSSDGNLTYAVQHTYDDVFSDTFTEDGAAVFTHADLTGETDNQEGNYTTIPTAMRLAVTAHTAGSVTMRATQPSWGG
jgi:hypothetical protein